MNTVQTVTIVGVGLIGGSIGLALRERQPTARVLGYGSRRTTLDDALAVGAITELAETPAAAVAEANLVIVCAPVDHIVAQVCQLAPLCRPGTLLTDAGSTKGAIVAQLADAAAKANWPAGVEFIGSHPLAGNEKTGPRHASSELFVQRAVVVTPHEQTTAEALARLTRFWELLGARVVSMSADEHDRALALTSHLPHLAAAAIAGVTPEQYVTLTAGGWQDTTRIAAGDPALWRQIMLSNRENLLTALGDLTQLLECWRQALAAGDAAELERLLTEAKHIRDALGS